MCYHLNVQFQGQRVNVEYTALHKHQEYLLVSHTLTILLIKLRWKFKQVHVVGYESPFARNLIVTAKRSVTLIAFLKFCSFLLN